MMDASDFSDVEDLTESYHEEDFQVAETNSSRKVQRQRFLSKDRKSFYEVCKLSPVLYSAVTDSVEDETTGTILFYESFLARYGHCHPMFFHGTLDAALREATQRPAKDVRT